MDEAQAMDELETVLGKPSEEPQDTQTETDDEGYVPTPPGACEVCHEPLIPHDTHQADEGYNGECGHCYFGDLSLGQRIQIIEELVIPVASKWGEAETQAKLQEAVALASTLAESRDARLVGQWADGFLAGLKASRKLSPNGGLTPESFAKLVEDHSSDSVLTGD